MSITVSYLIESRPRGTRGPWQRTGAVNPWPDRNIAEQHLATRRERQPSWEHRLVVRTTTVTEQPAEES
ncbi:hypothetical protein ACFWPV_10035 [Streptomyces uncialis]|uniref:hypothetical protein n=1 Tax=Streptomyces uncialis TaxID=1048205 RepID=UPI0036583D5E